jgi:hypothetical protein
MRSSTASARTNTPVRDEDLAPPRRWLERRVDPGVVGWVDGRARRDDLVDAVEEHVVQNDVGGGELAFEVLRRARADDRRGDSGVVEYERDRSLGVLAPPTRQPALGQGLWGMTAMLWRAHVGRTSASTARTRIEDGGCSVTKRSRRRSRAAHWASTSAEAGKVEEPM